MASFSWPPSLPQNPRQDMAETGSLKVIRTPVDKGPAKIRYSGRLAEPFNISWLMTSAQVSTLRTFVYSTLKGCARFDLTHPRTAELVEVRFVPGSDGGFYSCEYYAPDWWVVSATLEIMP